MTLNSVLDKLFDYLSLKAGTSSVSYHEIKLRKIMDLLGELVFKVHIDSQKRGYCYGFEIYEYFKSKDMLFSGLNISEEELSVFMRFIG
jgi:hypothetical protein